ncbi:MAG TPA: hypothetical protein VKD72_09625, partial [Gemmataceae bacterium]|nr:hypothetical protein [Gemmataceae bacterium]
KIDLSYLEKIDFRLTNPTLGPSLPRYPHQAGMLKGPNGRFDNPNAAAVDPSTGQPFTAAKIQAQYLLAQQARQNLAADIYRRLLIVTGAPAPAPANLATPTDAELAPLRWLAQLAVNIVDYIDEDEISTPFNFYAVAYNVFATQAGLPANQLQLPATAASTNTPNKLANETVPKYWVFGTELPPVTLNEALVEYQEPFDATNNVKIDGPFFVQVWTELFTPFPKGPLPAGVQVQDNLQIPLYHDIIAGNPGTDYSIYKVAIANTDVNAYGPLMNIPGNVTGTPSELRSDGVFTSKTTRTVANANPTTAPTALDPQALAGGYLLMGADSNTRDNSISANNPDNVPGTTPWVQTKSMKYAVTRTNGAWSIDDRPTGVTILLRRLANPHLPPDPNPTVTDPTGNVILNPVYNPYLTVDYMEKVPLNDATTPTPKYASRGKLQTYASDFATQINDQKGLGKTSHTFGQLNNPAPASGKAEWLLHLDRTPVSPMELLYVSGFRPHELTHRFITNVGAQQHRAPWFDEDLPVPTAGQQRPASHRLWRLFAFLEIADRAARISPRGRTPGKLNINTIWELEVLQALCDAGPPNNPNPNPNTFTTDDVTAMWDSLLLSRTPGIRTPGGPNGPFEGTTIGANDRPFIDLAAAGHLPTTDPQATGNGGITNGRGLEDTLFRLQDPTAAADAPRLFRVANAKTAAHPYLQYDMLTKVYNNLTTRSNTFGVWLTVGFFQVVDDTTVPVKLGPEIGATTATNIRHRFFSIVDRTQIVLAPQLTSSVANPFGQPPNPNGQVTVAELNKPKTITVVSKILPTDPLNGLNGRIFYSDSLAPPFPVGVPWAIQVGSIVVVDRGNPQEETVVVTNVDTVNNTFEAIYQRPHAQGFGITIPGNPGPQPQFDPTSPTYTPVVPYWEILQ